MKEKILLVTPSLDIEWMKSFSRFTNELKKRLEKKYDIEVLEINRNRKKEYHRIFFEIPYLELKSKAKVILAITPESGWFIPFIPNKKGIVTFHDFIPFNSKFSGYKNILYEIVTKFVYFITWKLSTYNFILISNSSQTAKDLKIFFNKNSKIIVHGLDINTYKIILDKKLQEPIKLGFFSNFSYRKGADIAIEIYNKLKNKISCELILSGGELTQAVSKQFNIKNLVKNDKNIKILGYIPEKDLPKLYNSFDFYLFPSRAEGYGLPIIEAAACGIPVFTLKDAKIPKETKKASIICKDADEVVEKILELSKNKKLYNKIRFEKMKYARQFTWDSCVKEYERLIEKALKEMK